MKRNLGIWTVHGWLHRDLLDLWAVPPEIQITIVNEAEDAPSYQKVAEPRPQLLQPGIAFFAGDLRASNLTLNLARPKKCKIKAREQEKDMFDSAANKLTCRNRREHLGLTRKR